MATIKETLIHHGLDARDYRLLDRAAGYACALVAHVTGFPVRKLSVFCYTAPGSSPATAVYDSDTQSIGVHMYLLENITKHLHAIQKDSLEQMFVLQEPFEHLFAAGNCTHVIAALIHEHAHHQFYTKLQEPIRALLGKRGELLVNGMDDPRVQAMNEGFAYAVQDKATGLVGLSEERAHDYDLPNVLAQYYTALRSAEIPLADALFSMIEQKGFSDNTPVSLPSQKARSEENRRRLNFL